MLTHGGDIAGYCAEYGKPPLDFSANLSPLGMPEGVRAAAAEAARNATDYPDPLCRDLCAAIAASEGVDPAQVVCGNGAADLIFRLVLALRPKRAVVPVPSFAEYEAALTLAGCQVVRHELAVGDGFALTERILDDLTEGMDLLFLCQPNNPTGLVIPRALLGRILARCEAIGATLVVDECFVPFLDDPDAISMTRRLGSPNLVLLKAFTKLYAMAGLRLGYCLSGNACVLETLRGCGQPWAVSSVAQAAGIAALQEYAYVGRVRRLIASERAYLAEQLAELGLAVTPPTANFVFFQGPEGLDSALRPMGILLRGCGNFPGLDNRYYRACVRTREENEALIAALQALLSLC